MSDTTYNKFQHYGTNAERLAFTPSPPAATQPIYIWYETDTGLTYIYHTEWILLGGGVAPPPAEEGAASTFLVSGGQVTWESAYTFRVSAASYYINGLPYTSAEQVVSLTAADATNDRIDAIVLDTAGIASAIAGTPATTPSEPSIDPAAYLKLGLVFVEHATTAPPTVSTILVYAENAGPSAEWTWTSSGASIIVNSTSTPHSGTTSIEGTSVVAGVYAKGVVGVAIDPNDYDNLLMFIRSKAAWNSSRGLLVTLRAAGVVIGATIQIRRSGTYGFDSTVTTGYQQVAIPITSFAIPEGTTIDEVRIEDFGGSIGFFIDNISFQVTGTIPPGVSGITQDEADARYAPLVHATRHSSGGADPVTVTNLAGYPGGTTNFLRADGTFAAPPGGTPTAHATSHETGGSDAIDTLDAAVITTGTIASARLPTRIGGVGVTIDGGGSAITTGVKGFIQIPYAGTITEWTILSNDSSATSGSIVFDVWKDTYANYPPTVADTITASAKPTLSSANKATSSTLTGWTTAVTAGDVIGFNVDSITTVTKITLTIKIQAS